jgi:hypothetical protein
MPPRTQVTAPERRALDKIWAENPAGRTKLYASARTAGLNVTQRQVGTYLRELPAHQLFLPQRKTKALTVIRRSKPLHGDGTCYNKTLP